MACVVAITGGIGSGKSVVSAILRAMGYSVCDTDSFAKGIMDNSDEIKVGLYNLFGAEAITPDNQINRAVIANKVFSDSSMLKRLNALVHPIVTRAIIEWIEGFANEIVFIETAILNESGLASCVNYIWSVDAPTDIRIDRVVKRNNISRDAVMDRINAQRCECYDGNCVALRSIINDGSASLITQIDILLNELIKELKGVGY